jgi:homoserine kinase type II
MSSVTFDLSAVWDLPKGTFAQPMEHGGYNNHLYRVEAKGEPPMVLRVYGNHANPKYIQHELTVLYLLQQHKLPFALPVPIPTKRGEMWGNVVTGANGTDRKLMVMIPFIPGTNPIPSNLEQTTAAAEALAHLLVALKKVEVQGVRSPSPYNELGLVHPLIPEPLEAISHLGSLLDEDKRNRLQAVLKHVVDASNKIYKRLPHQLTHSDFITGNILMDGPKVTGILDFEYCAPNPRVMDFAIAIDMWTWDVYGTGEEWERVDALVKGFSRIIQLNAEEIQAIPTLILLRNAGVLMHVIGRFVANLSPFVDVEMWLDAMLTVDAWLTLNGKKLVERVART